MNEEEILLYVWIKFLAEKYSLLEHESYYSKSYKTKKNFLFFDIIYEEDFIFKFILTHFNLHLSKVIPNLERDLNKYLNDNVSREDKVEIIKYMVNSSFKEFYFTPSEKELIIFNKDIWSKEGIILLWKTIFTITFLYEFNLKNKNLNASTLEHFEHSFSAGETEGLHIYNIYNMYKEEKKMILKGLKRNPLLFKFMVNIVYEVLGKVKYSDLDSNFANYNSDLYTFEEIEKLFLEVNKFCKNKNMEKTVVEHLDLSKCKSQNQSQLPSPCKAGNPNFIHNISFESQNDYFNNNSNNQISPMKRLRINFTNNQNLVSNSEVSTSRSLHGQQNGMMNKLRNKEDTFKLSLKGTCASTEEDQNNKDCDSNPNQALFEQIISLTSSLYQLEDEKEELLNRIENLSQDNEKLQSVNFKNENFIKSKEDQISNLEKETMTLKGQLVLKQNEISDMNEKIENMQDRLKEMQDVKNNNQKLKEEIKRKRSEIFCMINNKELEIQNNKSTQSTQTTVINNPKMKMQRFSFNFLKSITESTVNSSNKTHNSEYLLQYYTDMLDTKSRIIENKNSEIMTFNQKNLELRMQLKHKQLKIERYREKNSELSQIINSQEEKITKYKKKINMLNTEIESNNSNWIYIFTIILIIACILIFLFVFKFYNK